MIHRPVLLREVLYYLKPQPNQNFIDCTVGGGGHAKEILKRTGPRGKLLAVDWDPQAIEIAKENLVEFKNRIIFVQDNFVNLKKIADEHPIDSISGILFDLGLSSYQLADRRRGFSFQKSGPLEMSFSQEEGLKARDIINRWNEEELSRIFKEYGQERKARLIAKKIVETRRVKSIDNTQDLVKIILKVKPKRGRLHPATKIFQALRIAVNKELENLEKALPQAVEILKIGGRLAVISFHSLEDRIVKQFFKGESVLNILTKKPVTPPEEEMKSNPRSRSAKLRVAEKF